MPKVLLIEPDSLLASNLSLILAHDGHEVDWQVEPQGATDVTDQKKPDVIVMDLMLAGRNGVEFLYELRSYPEWASIPVIIHSDLDHWQSLLGIQNLSISSYLNKQKTTGRELSAAIQSLLTVAA